MSSRRRQEQCRICGGALQGNQRRWLFSGNKKNQSHTPSGSVKAQSRSHSRSQSNCSSPWGSTLSLGSSASLTKSHLSSNASKNFDLLSILMHILGRSVSRSQNQSEFICGKCVSVLERVFKYDTVIARVRVLSSERLQKLVQERDKIRHWVRNSYIEKNPQETPSRGSTSEEDGESEKDGYREMLRDNMALSEYECWSEKWDTCPYFIRTGKRCRKGKGCEGCDALRVSDSDYESVCGVPRHLPFQSFSPLAFSRDKSHSMPLNWHKVPSACCSSPASLAGSTVSLNSRTESIQSLDSLDGHDPFEMPHSISVNFLLKEIGSFEGKAVDSPAGSKIPVLDRGHRRRYSEESKEMEVSRVLNFENGEKEEEDGDVLTELRDEFVPLYGQNNTGRSQQVMKLLRAQLDQARTRIRTLEDQLQHGTKQEILNGSGDGINDVQDSRDSAVPPLQCLGLSLRSRERLLQECMSVIRRLCVEDGKGPELSDKLTEKLSESLKEAASQNKAALDKLEREVFEEKQRLEEELEALRKASADRERDLDTLQTVLQANQDLIHELRVSLGDKEQQLKSLCSEREVYGQRERALNVALNDKDSLLLCLKQELDTCYKDVQALSDTVLAEGSTGDKTEALVSRLKEKESELAAVVKEREENSATMCQEVTKLTTALQQYQTLVQSQQENHSQALASLSSQLSETRAQLRDRERERKEATRVWQKDRDENDRQKKKLMDSVDKRDRLIEQILQDAEEQEHLFRELQQNLQNKFHPATGFKHTL